MRLTVVGCSGSFPGPHAAASCYLVEADGQDDEGQPRVFRLLLDLGSGALGPLQSHVGLDEIDAIALSHLHPDHCLDVCGLYVYLRYRPEGPSLRRPRLLGPDGTAERLARAYDLPLTPGMHAELDIAAHTPAQGVRIGPMTLTAYEVEHPVPAYALRVEGPREDGPGRAVLAYSGDTDECPGLLEAARDVDLLLCEAAYHEGRDQHTGVHLTGVQAGRVAAEAGARSLLLTHIPPWNDPALTRVEAQRSWSGPLDLAEPGMLVRL